jgi:hypothetical protein
MGDALIPWDRNAAEEGFLRGVDDEVNHTRALAEEQDRA